MTIQEFRSYMDYRMLAKDIMRDLPETSRMLFEENIHELGLIAAVEDWLEWEERQARRLNGQACY